ncbi:trypsin-like peptidase [Kribbella sp. VKM Ac-2527]|uniref:Trypsin-like peptidase n=1 Tax=Kribbella caucasensis TaxID=2512215 RepID=A0A4R6KNR7_9ACTN|nr:serine protease [Kribbella sp. VKM Ac-2527]TDO52656.1 trypsin-like peptidase [Kribbella sp. VKM Ac-2527]
MPPRLRFRFLVPLIVFVLVLGAGAGWLVREQSLSLATGDVMDASGPTVVRVLATTCEGTGQAAGVLLPDGIVLTAASAIREPVSVGVLTADGRVRRANVLGADANGIAVLKLTSRLDNPTAALAPNLPDADADRAIIGYTSDGDQFVQQAGTANQPRRLAEILGAGSLGAPLFDKRGRLIGLVTGDTVAQSKVIGLDDLGGPYAGSGTRFTPEPVGTCPARGPQQTVKPDLAVANTPTAGEVQQSLGEYLDTLNRHDFAAMQKTYSDRLERLSNAAVDATKHGTSYAFGAVVTEVSAAGDDDANARMKFVVLFSQDNPGARGQTCSRLDIRYHLVREEGRLRIDNATSMAPQDSSCDTD